MNKIFISMMVLIAFASGAELAAAETTKIERLEGKIEPELSSGLYKITSGLDYSEGFFTFQRKVRVQAAPVTLSYERVNLFLAATVAGLNVYAPNTTSTVVVGGTPSFSQRHGLGDVTLNANYIYFLNQSTYADLSAAVTLPTGNSRKGLGEGEYYYLVNADITRHFGSFYLFAGAGYNWKQQPWHFTARNAFRAGTGGGITLNEKLDTSLTISGRDANTSESSSFGIQSVTNYYCDEKLKLSATYDWQEAVDVLAPYNAVTAALEYGIGEKDVFRMYALAGLSSAAPDIATGISFEHAF